MNRHNPQMLYVGQTKDTGALAFTPDLIKANRNFILPFNGYIHHEDHIAVLDAANEEIKLLREALNNTRHQVVGFKGNAEILTDIDEVLKQSKERWGEL